MDAHTLQVLDYIRRKVMRRHEKDLYKTELAMGDGNDRKKLEWALTQSAYSHAQKQVVKEALEQDDELKMLDRTTTKVDQKVADLIEREMQLEIQAAFEAGILKKKPLDNYAKRHLK